MGNGELVAQTDPNGQDVYRYGYGRTNCRRQPVIEQVFHAGSRAYLEHDANGTPLVIRSDSGTSTTSRCTSTTISAPRWR